MTLRAPALFVGHGSPMNAIEDTPSARGWAAIAQRFERPRAIVVVSAHWLTASIGVSLTATPILHDFGKSFPPELFAVRYRAPSDPELAAEIIRHLKPVGGAHWTGRGLDHGGWSVLRRMYPDADVPVIPVGIDVERGPDGHFAIAQRLGELREDNIMILASGNIVHNLPGFFQTTEIQPWVQRFDDFIVAAAEHGDDRAILDYKSHPDAVVAAPDADHFYPVFYGIGARRKGEHACVFNQHYFPGISMTSFGYGLPE